MAKSVLELAVGTGQWDAGLKKAKSALDNFTQANGGLQKALATDSDKMQQFVKMMGQMDSTAKTAKGQMNDYKGTIEQLTMQYNRMTEAQKQTIGQDYLRSIDQLKQKYQGVAEEVQKINQSLKSMPEPAALSGGGGVMNNLKGVLNGVAGKFGMSASMFTGVGAAVAGAAGAFKLLGDNISLAMNFEKSMSQLSSLTGMAGKDLDQLKEYAIELGSTSTLTASQVADAFRLIGSQQPQLLESGQALKEVTKYAITLSEAAGIDLQTAAQTLSTSINQMGGDSNNASRYVNVLAAASQKGAGDIAWLGEAITKSATAAKAVGTDYEELVANLEQLAKAGFDASTAGTALRSIIMNLEKQANNDFKPSVVGLTQAFENLGKANLDIVGYQQIAGKMFASQAMALANAAGEARNMTAAITDTNVATEQATTNTANLDGSLKSLSSAWEALNLHINSSNGLLKDAVDWFKEVVQWADQSFTAAGRAQKRLAELKGEQNTSGGKSTGNTKVDRQISTLSHASADRREGIYNQEVQNYWRYINAWQKKLKEAEGRKDLWAWETIKKQNDITEARNKIDGAKELLKEYQQRAKSYITQPATTYNKGGKAVVDLSVDVDGDGSGMKTIKQLQDELKELKKLRDDAINKKDFKARDTYNTQIKQTQDEIKILRGSSTTTTTHVKPIEEKVAWDANKANIAATKTEDTMPSVWAMMGGDAGLRQMMGIGAQQWDYGKVTDEAQGKGKKNDKKEEKKDDKMMDNVTKLTSGVTGIFSGIEQMGIEIPDGMKQALNAINGLMSIAQSILVVVEAIKGLEAVGLIKLAGGGIVPHAAGGYMIGGNSYSGDNIYAGGAWVNSGELVLNRAQQSTLASQLQGQDKQMHVVGEVQGEKIILVANRTFRRKGQGEIVTW